MNVDVAHTDPAGMLVLPADVDRAGWWNGSSRLGDPFGAILLAAHVDSFTKGIGPIAELLDARQGDRLRVAGRELSQQFEVVSVKFVAKTTLAQNSAAFSPSGDRRLVLITCGGPYDAANGGYRDNLVVVATAVGPLREN